MSKKQELKRGSEYIDHYERINENEIFIDLFLNDGEYIGIIHRKED